MVADLRLDIGWFGGLTVMRVTSSGKNIFCSYYVLLRKISIRKLLI